jgi:hypothetical protein
MYNKIENNNRSVKSIENKCNTNKPWISILLAVLLLLNFIILGIGNVNDNTNPEDFDTTAYLGDSNLIKINGGIKNFLKLCVNGTYRQANQHPMYTLLLSSFATRDISFFVNAKIASLVVGFLLLTIMFVLISHDYGDICASIAALGMLFNTTFLKWTTAVACESLLMLFSFLSIFFILKGFEYNKNWILAGTFAGLSFMTKGTALFLIPGFFLVNLFIYKLDFLKNKYFYAFIAMFILVSSPLILRNVIVYKNPLYNTNTAKLSYSKEQIDQYGYVLYSPDKGANLEVYPPLNNTTKKENLQNNENLNIRNIIGKYSIKVVNEAKTFLNVINIVPDDKFPKFIRLVIGFLLFGFFFLGLSKEKKATQIYIIATLLIFIVCLSLFRKIDRYFLPIVPFIYLYASIGFIVLSKRFYDNFVKKIFRIGYKSFATYSLIVINIIIFGYNTATQSLSNPVNSVEYSESRYDLLRWMRNNLRKGDKYVEGPSLNWQLENGMWVIPPKYNRLNLESFNDFAKNNNIDYVIIDFYSLTVSRYRGGGVDKMKKLEGYFELDDEKGIIQKKSIDNWKQIYMDPREKVEFIIFKIV